jgi:RimK family alpha-L-glutamate ligase
MYGWLIVNHFLRNAKFDEVPRWLTAAASKKGVDLQCMPNAEVLAKIGVSRATVIEGKRDPDFIIFWDKDIHLAHYLENLGFRLFNPAHAIQNCDDKFLTHLALMNTGIPTPKTVAAPLVFNGDGYGDFAFIDEVIDFLGLPLVIKECYGSFGKQVYLAKNKDDTIRITKEAKGKPLLYQELVETSFGKDIRIQTVGDKIVTAMFRHSETGDFRANVTNGGLMIPYKPTIEQEKMTLAIVAYLGLDFAGVDLLFDGNGMPLLCEVNSNAHFKNIFDCTGVNTADFIIDYIVDETYSR